MVFEYDTTTKLLMKLAAALIKAVDEHGAPNSFALSELVGYADAMAAGKAIRTPDWGALIMNVNHLRPGTVVTRENGRIHVAHSNEPSALHQPVWFADQVERGNVTP